MARRRGFTLVELMIVLAVIAIVAAVAIPGLLHSRIGANETAALGSLKCISVGEYAFRNGAAVDLNKDGQGEFGFLEEVAGVANCRSNNAGATAGPLFGPGGGIPSILGTTNANAESTKSGYFFVVYLPSGPAAGVKAYPSAVDVGEATESHVAYAFPSTAGKTGRRVFCISVGGTLYQFPNLSNLYGGTGAGPKWNDFLKDTDGVAGVTWDDGADIGGPGQTGSASEKWVAVGG